MTIPSYPSDSCIIILSLEITFVQVMQNLTCSFYNLLSWLCFSHQGQVDNLMMQVADEAGYVFVALMVVAVEVVTIVTAMAMVIITMSDAKVVMMIMVMMMSDF